MSNYETDVTFLIKSADQNVLANNVHHSNTNEIVKTEGLVEAYAIDVLMKCCTMCKGYKEYRTINGLKKHFMTKHMDVPVQYEVVKSRDRVECSACRVRLKSKNFNRHKDKLHTPHLAKSINQTEPSKDANQNESQLVEIEEPFAIDVPSYNCRLCKIGPMTKMRFDIHFEVKHNNAEPAEQDFDVVKCDKRIRCSRCNAEMFMKNFVKHKSRVHFVDSINRNESSKNVHQNASEPKGSEDTIDILVTKCKVCEAECVTEKCLMKHFQDKHKQVPTEFVVVKSNIFVRCSACKTQIKKKNLNKHKRKCVNIHAQTSTIISSRKDLQTNYQKYQKAVKGEYNQLSVREMFENDKCAMKLIAKDSEKEHKHPMAHIRYNAHTIAPKLFKCKICDANDILEQTIMKHFMDNHYANSNRNFLLNSLNNDFELVKRHMPKSKCQICRVELDESRRDRHMRTVHPEFLPTNEEEPSTDDWLCERDHANTGQRFNTIQIYKCLACDARDIMEPNLVKHHLKKHIRIAIDVDIFEIIGKMRREKCNICQKYFPESRLKEHKKRSHYKKMRPVVFDRPVDIPIEKCFNRTLIQNIEPVLTELHKCLICGAVVAEVNLKVHHKNHKKKNSKNIFKLIGIKNVIKCVACLKFIEPQMFKNHLNQHKTRTFLSADGNDVLNPEPDVNGKSKRQSTKKTAEYLPKYRRIYKCRACNITEGKMEFIVDRSLNGIEIRKHQRVHLNASIRGNIFKLFMVKVKCNVCDCYMKEDMVEKHMRLFHNWNYDMNFVPLYKCGSCHAQGISKRNLEAHHSRMHNFPIESSDFKICALKQKIECDFCGKRYMEGKSKKHNLKACCNVLMRSKRY